ncbi:hypothetical protein ACFWMR_34920 [Amycolatopsis thailandensis]|uniref:hypothetical protein n=1 Tax=Amycolatopsis thailandensis TaxID=589330 RepID=UPI001FC9C5E3|nr:hypothetical protein [Amycolatopsis thailandensis]
MVTETGVSSDPALGPEEFEVPVPPEDEQAEISSSAASIPAVESNVFLGNMRFSFYVARSAESSLSKVRDEEDVIDAGWLLVTPQRDPVHRKDQGH